MTCEADLRHCCRAGSSEEWVAEFEGAVACSGVHVLGVEDGCVGTDAGFDDQGVPVADAALLNALEGELNQGGVDGFDVVLAKLIYRAGDFHCRKGRLPLSTRHGDELAKYLRTENEAIVSREVIH